MTYSRVKRHRKWIVTCDVFHITLALCGRRQHLGVEYCVVDIEDEQLLAVAGGGYEVQLHGAADLSGDSDAVRSNDSGGGGGGGGGMHTFCNCVSYSAGDGPPSPPASSPSSNIMSGNASRGGIN